MNKPTILNFVSARKFDYFLFKGIIDEELKPSRRQGIRI